jgi:CheY-like chemotaxis protein
MERPVVVLLVEDSPTDRKITADVLEEAQFAVQLFVVERGEDALAFLRLEGDYADCPRPDLVLLDLGLPGIAGHEVLAEIRADARLRTIPVVVQTANDDDQTMVEILGLGAHEFVSKPLTREQFQAVVEYVTEFA